MPMMRAGVSLAMRQASRSGMLALVTATLMRRSIVAMEPASAERSLSLHTPSSMMTRGSKALVFELPLTARASVMSAVRSTPLMV